MACACALLGCSTSTTRLAPLSSVKQSVATEGTLANDTLIRDTTAAIHKAARGTKPLTKFVVQQPVGPTGRKAWRELWVYDPQGTQQKFIITFTEDGTGSAGFQIQRM